MSESVTLDQDFAIKSLIRSIESNPLDLQAYRNLARSYESAGAFRKAELTLRRAIEIEPLHQETWVQLGVLYIDRGQWQSAAETFEQACALDPTDPTSWIGHCMTLIATQNIECAVEACSALLEKFPARSESHLLHGHTRKIQGQTERAAESYRRALEIDPRQTEAMFNLVELLPPEPLDPLTENLELLRQDPSLSHRQLANVCFALARVYETADQVDKAFAVLREANLAAVATMRDLRRTYIPSNVEDETTELIETFSPEVFTGELEPLDLDTKMIFIVGLPRTGTTLTERILSSHSQVSTGGELPYMQDCLIRLRTNRQPPGRRGHIKLEDREERQLLRQLRDEYVDRLFERDLDSEYVVDKLPANFAALGLIRVLFPNAIIIHCTRDPIATFWSLYSAHFGVHLSYYNSFENLVHYYRNYKRLMTHWEDIFAADIVKVNYEELVMDSEPSIRKLIMRCGLPWEDACLSFYENKLPIYTASVQQARRPIYQSSISGWRKFEKFLGPLKEGLAAESPGH